MRDTVIRLLQLIYFMAPAYCANMAPPFVRYWHGWNRPIHARWLGSHKTVVGFGLGVAGGVAATAVQCWIGLASPIISYEHWLALGLGFGIGSMGGDAAKSFIKRRLGIPPGKPWMPFDQLDFPIGALLVIAPFANLYVTDIPIILVMTFVGDITVNWIAFRLRVKDVPF